MDHALSTLGRLSGLSRSEADNAIKESLALGIGAAGTAVLLTLALVVFETKQI